MSYPSHIPPQSNISIDFNDPPVGMESWLEENHECHEAHALLKSLVIDQINQIPVANFNLVLQQCRNRASQRVSMHASQQVQQLKLEMERMHQENQRLTKMLHKEMKQRQQYYNELQLLKGAIRIFVRVRPVLPSEAQQGDAAILRFSKNNPQLMYFPKSLQDAFLPESEKVTKQTHRPFQFDRIIGPQVHQKQ